MSKRNTFSWDARVGFLTRVRNINGERFLVLPHSGPKPKKYPPIAHNRGCTCALCYSTCAKTFGIALMPGRTTEPKRKLVEVKWTNQT
jgi:hypothetical protein